MTEDEIPEPQYEDASAGDDDSPPDISETDNTAGAPDYLPEKFWDGETGEVRVEDLARSYAALERRLGAAGGDTVPETADGYRIEPMMEGLSADTEVNERLMQAGFTQAQAQLVYDLAAEKLAPLVQDLALDTVQRRERERLAEHFGGTDKWQAVAGQLETWGKAHLPEPVLQALSTSYDGVLALHRMMADGEPDLVTGGDPAPGGRSEADLRRMMEDPRYWRDHDPDVAARVRKGFEELYPEES